MRDAECVTFLQWALPRMGFCWTGYRKVRRQVCKRIGRRLRELELEDLQRYRRFLAAHAEEWQVLEGLCRITISRFGRDRGVFRTIMAEVLPRLARRVQANGQQQVKIWSAGCGAGEEPYALTILREDHDDPSLAGVCLDILATDADEHQLRRARAAVYPISSLRELSSAARGRAFEQIGANSFHLRERYRENVELRRQDLRHGVPEGSFHLILCRNLAFTYFDLEHQCQTLAVLEGRLIEGGYLVVGSHEKPPTRAGTLAPIPGCPCILGPMSPGIE